MSNNEKLNADEIMVLQWLGYEDECIRRTSLAEFDRLYDEDPRLEELLEKANSLLDRQEEAGVVSLPWHSDRYPKRLLKIGADAPALIHLQGNLDLLTEKRAVAGIGARAADNEGNKAAYELGWKYTREGAVIVSGLALGCDASAHVGCLDNGGKTIAIVGNGLDICHPRENAALQQRILDNGGLLLSEQPFGVKANPKRLVARNRLQAALSTTVILAQCPEQSGSMHTMRFARKYRKKCRAVQFPKATDANGGNRLLIAGGFAEPIPFASLMA